MFSALIEVEAGFEIVVQGSQRLLPEILRLGSASRLDGLCLQRHGTFDIFVDVTFMP